MLQGRNDIGNLMVVVEVLEVESPWDWTCCKWKTLLKQKEERLIY
jgi:hypothetical protein